MKKLLMFLLLFLGVSAAGAGYYIFYYMPNHGDIFGLGGMLGEKTQAKAPVTPDKQPLTSQTSELTESENMDYYVAAKTLPIRSEPSSSGLEQGSLYRGDQVSLLEKSDGWGRITEYFVYTLDEPAKAKWVSLEGLVTEKPVITSKERKETVLGYINESDDLGKYQETFFNVTNELLVSNQCKPQDFEVTSGWVKSVSFNDRDVYFVYCGGLDRLHKIYLDASNGKTFRLDE